VCHIATASIYLDADGWYWLCVGTARQAADPGVWLARVLGRSTRWIREPWPSAVAGGRAEGGADPAVVGGVEGEAGGDDLVDAVEDVVGEAHAGSGEL